MTRLKIKKFKFFVFILIILESKIIGINGNYYRDKRQAGEVDTVPLDKKNDNKGTKDSNNLSTNEPNPKISLNDNGLVIKKTEVNITAKSALNNPTTILPNTSTEHASGVLHLPTVNYGALTRGILVIVGLSVLVMVYMVFRSFRLNKSRAQMVRKYGVLAHRQDVEMRPLPLDEDDEDDTTVFDASNIPSHRLQSQDS